jgi:thiosulfate dehydrogenase
MGSSPENILAGPERALHLRLARRPMKSYRSGLPTLILSLFLLTGVFAGCSAPPPPAPAPGVPRYPLAGPLIPARMTMATAWDVPRNPLADPTLDDSTLSKEIRWGYQIFTNTPGEAGRLTPSHVSCNNCHLNAGQRERALPLVSVAGMFPEYNRRAGRLITLADRIVDCFLRSENATGRADEDDPRAVVSPTDAEVLAVSAYLTWLARGYEVGKNPVWRGQNAIAAKALIPIAQLDRHKGEQVYTERCVSCHGTDGQGVAIGDKKAGPLWGPRSWNDGAGAARVYTLAGIIRYTMPYLDPGRLTDEEAQHVAAFINSQPRPAFPLKDRDYLVDPLPVDAVYYPRR